MKIVGIFAYCALCEKKYLACFGYKGRFVSLVSENHNFDSLKLVKISDFLKLVTQTSLYSQSMPDPLYIGLVWIDILIRFP